MVRAHSQITSKGPGRFAPAVFFASTLALVLPQASLAQQRPPAAASAPAAALDQMQLAKLVWGTMLAVEQGNQSGNYSVLRDIAAPGFQTNNDAAKLAQIFANLRASGMDLSNSLLLAPTFRSQPRMVQADMLQLQGSFGLRPTAINFDLLYQWSNGKWRLFGVAIAPAPMTGAEAPPQPAPPQPRKK
jgi:hypothetical protein